MKNRRITTDEQKSITLFFVYCRRRDRRPTDRIRFYPCIADIDDHSAVFKSLKSTFFFDLRFAIYDFAASYLPVKKR
ncbi:MAG: hypothetical protein LBS43_06490 [Prevotellaceae bacterium]|nr:hypothetical protein [Prevotellaceae bacterium]